jgi:hypothetical protein
MSEFTERVAESLLHHDLSRPEGSFPRTRKEFWDEMAKVAIATMRDPSQGMRIAGHAALIESDSCASNLGHEIGYGALGDAWRAMIDDALAWC